jgi:transcriptional regulator with GAF, ATPase, and Fis domain
MIDPLEQITQQMTSTLDQGEVLAAVTRGLIEDLGAALARIWLVEPGDICGACREAPRCLNRERCLHLQASAGLSTRLDGAHRRVPIGALKIGQIALSREPMWANQIETDERITDKAWVRRNGLASFAGYPLLFQGELLGVLAMFAKRPLSGADLERLSLFANRAAIAIQNARLYTELAALKGRLEAENIYLHEELRRGQADGELIGESPALLEALSELRQVAPTSSTVLLYGETGTGLVESELFGHEKGAFTTALGRRIGRFELASGGTLLLDEVGELPLETQAKLLRVLQEREMERVGGSETLRVDVRVVAATNRDLAAEVQRGRFRADLYYRLAVFPIHVPPLRARRSDIPLLCSAFLEKQARALRKPHQGRRGPAHGLRLARERARAS